ncbi:hypothetical protein V2I01_34525 [Micromonospora sp. BRA006-A]|nr:hypothetical protein [Micromonospora sp. BRA006-A]
MRAWQESWDRQQEAYLPDREHRFAAMLDAVEAVAGDRPPRVLDLAAAPDRSACGHWPAGPTPR